MGDADEDGRARGAVPVRLRLDGEAHGRPEHELPTENAVATGARNDIAQSARPPAPPYGIRPVIFHTHLANESLGDWSLMWPGSGTISDAVFGIVTPNVSFTQF